MLRIKLLFMATCMYTIVYGYVYRHIYNIDIIKIAHEDFIATVLMLKWLGEPSVYLLASCMPVGNLH